MNPDGRVKAWLILLLLLVALPARAGWFEVKTYVGTIGKSKVHLSLQTFDYINHEDAGRWKVDGSYYYDKYSTPIPLEGSRDAKGNVVLCEGSRFVSFYGQDIFKQRDKRDMEKCPIHVDISGKLVTGRWHGSHGDLPIHLEQVGHLDNTGLGKPELDGNVTIPLWYYTKKYMLLGVYKATDKCGPPSMTNMIVVDRSNGKRYRNMDLGCDFGNVATVVYMNAYHSDKHGYVTMIANGGHHGMGRDVDVRMKP